MLISSSTDLPDLSPSRAGDAFRDSRSGANRQRRPSSIMVTLADDGRFSIPDRFAGIGRSGFGGGAQPTALFTRAAMLFSSAAVSFVSAKSVAHKLPSSSLALSLNPSVAYLVLNFWAGRKKQTTTPSWA